MMELLWNTKDDYPLTKRISLREYAASALLANAPIWLMSALLYENLLDEYVISLGLLRYIISMAGGVLAGYSLARKTKQGYLKVGLPTGLFSYILYSIFMTIIGVKGGILVDDPPLVGFVIGALVGAKIWEKLRARSGNNLASYAGIVPSAHSSVKVTRHGRITREGSAWLRWAMVESALVHLKYDTPVTQFYHRVAERKGAKTARVAAALKLLTVCYSVLRSRRPYFNPVGAQV